MKNILFSIFFVLGSAALLYLAYAQPNFPLKTTPIEAMGFITGALCVWLTVLENIWNWPIGIANCAFYVAVFLKDRLFADMTLQIIYIVLAFLGWYMWLHGGDNKTVLQVSKTPAKVWIGLAVVAVLATFGMEQYLIRIKDSAPFLDALTTVVSLCAQFLITKKHFENWFVWIAVDVIYVYLYITRGLYLTAFLYVVFIGLCFAGLKQWSESMKKATLEPAVA